MEFVQNLLLANIESRNIEDCKIIKFSLACGAESDFSVIPRPNMGLTISWSMHSQTDVMTPHWVVVVVVYDEMINSGSDRSRISDTKFPFINVSLVS